MSEADKKTYKELRAKLNQVTGAKRRSMVKDLPAFWTVEVDRGLEREKSYILTSGDPERPEKDHPVEPGWPFYTGEMDFREGRVEAFSDWLTAKDNPLFARVAVNRLWQWHFGEGLHKSPSDYGVYGRPSRQPAAARLARFRVHRARLQPKGDAQADDDFERLSPGQLRRQRADEEESGGRSFEPLPLELPPAASGSRADLGFDPHRRRQSRHDAWAGRPSILKPVARAAVVAGPAMAEAKTNRRGAYIVRGFSTSREVVPELPAILRRR